MSKTFKLFNFTDVFNYQRGTRFIKKEQLPGDVAYISSTKTNNGIDNYVTPPQKSIKGRKITVYQNCLTLSNSGSVGYLFFHDYEFIASDHVTVIWLRDKKQRLTRNIALFLRPIFETMRYKYKFGREISNTRIKNEKIFLPIDDKGNPDWQYMENYIKNLEQTISFNPIESNNISKDAGLDIESWNWFSLSDIFTLQKGQEESAKTEEDFSGDFNLISATQFDNGVKGKKSEGKKQFKENLITVSSNGEVGEAFYQETPFYATADVNVLSPLKDNKLNKYSALFIATIIRWEKFKYAWGRKWGIERMKKSKIKLPAVVKEDGSYSPDWDFMENYIKSLPYADLI